MRFCTPFKRTPQHSSSPCSTWQVSTYFATGRVCAEKCIYYSILTNHVHQTRSPERSGRKIRLVFLYFLSLRIFLVPRLYFALYPSSCQITVIKFRRKVIEMHNILTLWDKKLSTFGLQVFFVHGYFKNHRICQITIELA